MKPLGNIKSTHDFESFGVELPPTTSTVNRIKYTGQERDGCTNYDYMHFRFYASSIGRFLRADNIIPNAFNPKSWNLYSYINNNPVNFNDPLGHTGQGMAKPYYFVNGGSASWLNLGAYNAFMSGLYDGNLSFGGGFAGGGNISSSQTYTYEVGKWVLSGWFEMRITTNDPPYEMIVYPKQAIWNYVSYTLTNEVTISEGKPIPYQLIPKTSIIGHLGIWEKIGQTQVGAGYGKYDISIEINIYKLVGVRTVFRYEDKVGIALEPQFFSIEDYRLYETFEEKEMFENRVDPYNINYFRLPKEPLGMSLTLGSIFEMWIQKWPM